MEGASGISGVDRVAAFGSFAVTLFPFRTDRFATQGDFVSFEGFTALEKGHGPSGLFDEDPVGLGFGRLGWRFRARGSEREMEEEKKEKAKPK